MSRIIPWNWTDLSPETSPHFSHLIVARRWRWLWIQGTRGYPFRVDPRKRTVRYVEEADRVQRSRRGQIRRHSRLGVRNAG